MYKKYLSLNLSRFSLFFHANKRFAENMTISDQIYSASQSVHMLICSQVPLSVNWVTVSFEIKILGNESQRSSRWLMVDHVAT